MTLRRDAPPASDRPRDGGSGFTLLEILAAIALLALLASLVLPTLDILGPRRVRADARQLAAACEFARARAVMTGRTHRVVLDLDRRLHRVEWIPPAYEEKNADSKTAKSTASGSDDWSSTLDPTLSGATDTVPLSPPAAAKTHFVPVPGALGRDDPLDRGVVFAEVDTPNGPITRGQVIIRFEPDGSADPTRIRLATDQGTDPLIVEVRPFADSVVVRHAHG